MKALLHGALVQYKGSFLGPIPNIVAFQFNPEQLIRRLALAPRTEPTQNDTKRPQRETGATAGQPVESFTITALFSAADALGANTSPTPRIFGIAPQLAALEKMIYPIEPTDNHVAAPVDGVSAALPNSSGNSSSQPVPRERVPNLLFIWGTSRILPVVVTSMTITEKQFDFLLNPVEAEVAIELEVVGAPDNDPVAKGALEYTNKIKDAQAAINLANTIEMAADIVSF